MLWAKCLRENCARLTSKLIRIRLELGDAKFVIPAQAGIQW